MSWLRYPGASQHVQQAGDKGWGVSVPWAGPPSVPWHCPLLPGLVVHPVQGSADCSKASASSVCACLRPASAWARTWLHWTSSVCLCSVSSSNLCLLGLGRHGVCMWARAGGKEPGSCASTLLCNQTSTGKQEQDWDFRFKSALLLLNRADVNPGSELNVFFTRQNEDPAFWLSFLELSLYIIFLLVFTYVIFKLDLYIQM